MAFNIVLVEPEIPQNTGNIVRTCAATGSVLHLVGPLGFSIEDKYLKRAGLDYWNEADVRYYNNLDEFKKKNVGKTFYYSTTKAVNNYCNVNFEDDCFIVFGKETAGLPEELLKGNKEYCIRIPMKNGIRSLNLSNSAAIVLYEALRQQNFKEMKVEGQMVKYEW
ncbi:tRNA (uridine(34)/cytosine(34)/5-carboxymethylaminomethyluridine(34)-2'-O)-methyltransferase TrmL [Ruminiclostridium cellulolyticum]|uniref:Putative tRNA (cytidine(34)-2'-O)-methyltransferase n=1 Tax=Ruminiclostridium cellulolyticum (strain ATCC 35319 / DSM 5812 / JCM 6584 / H10) TaxID=394503 RepID=B8I4W1_RUMCH|nr:tRNA (uridine(34)/cytosine(34)/5-carboxymethylaminomethyluridine(34)-2'-O)-methyltransferase TrmL [Ruminiclostridium cellulolyticum]ACL76615.1 tRNA/rRNA methyltransferase (SpoU) [Ruminiclostridium cellulolyticum H10]